MYLKVSCTCYINSKIDINFHWIFINTVAKIFVTNNYCKYPKHDYNSKIKINYYSEGMSSANYNENYTCNFVAMENYQ